MSAAPMPVPGAVGVHRERVDDGCRLRAPNIAEIHLRREVAGNSAIAIGCERNAHRGVVQRLLDLARDVLAAVATREPAIDANEVADVLGAQGAHVGVIARERLEVIRRWCAVVVLVAGAGLAGGERLVVAGSTIRPARTSQSITWLRSSSNPARSRKRSMP